MKLKDFKEYVINFSKEELIKYNYDIGPLNELALIEGKRLSKLYQADEDVVFIALALMDSKLPEAVSLKKPKEHVNMAVDVSKKMLLNLEDLSEEQKINILKCIEEHHGKVDKYSSIESEVVSNSDCYKFLSPKGIMMYASILGRRLNCFEKEWQQLELKMDEKIEHVSLDIAKEELIPCYEDFKKYLSMCKTDINQS